MILTAMLLTCCSTDSEVKAETFQTSSDMTTKLYLTIGGVTKTATLAGNSSAEALVAQLQKGNITYEAHDYGGFEKVGPLGYTFPQNNEDITTEPGDLILYLGQQSLHLQRCQLMVLHPYRQTRQHDAGRHQGVGE